MWENIATMWNLNKNGTTNALLLPKLKLISQSGKSKGK